MPFFDLRIRWVESSDFGPKSDDLGHRILKADFIPSDFAKADCISRSILFSDRKIKSRSSESDRIVNDLTPLSLALFPGVVYGITGALRSGAFLVGCCYCRVFHTAKVLLVLSPARCLTFCIW